MKKILILPQKRTFVSIILVCAMLVSICFTGGALSVSALTNPTETVSSWTMTSDFETVGYAQQWYARLRDPINAKDGWVLAINARSNQHNHASLGRSMVFNKAGAEEGTYDIVALEAGKYTVSYKYYLETLEEGFYAPKDTDGNPVVCDTCSADVKAYNDGESAASYEIYFGVVSNADESYDVASSKLVSKSNSLFSYDAAKQIDFKKYGWQNGTVSFIVTQDMVDSGSNIFAMYRKAVGHAVYLRDISVNKITTDMVSATDYGLMTDFTKADVLPATDSSSDIAGAVSINNDTNSLYNNTGRFKPADVEVPGAGKQSAMEITFSNHKRATAFTTGLAAKDYMTLKSGTSYQISFDYYNPNYSLYDNTLAPILTLTNIVDGNPIVSSGTVSNGFVTLLSGEEIFSDAAANGYVRVVRDFEVAADVDVTMLGLYSYCKNNSVFEPYYIDNIQITEAKNTAVFDLGNENLEEDNITVTYAESIVTPASVSDTLTRATNLTGWRDAATGEIFELGATIPKEVTARYLGKNAVFNAVYNGKATFNFDSNAVGAIPSNVSGKAATLVADTDGTNKYVSVTQQWKDPANPNDSYDRHFLLYGQTGNKTNSLASYEKYRTYKITFDYKCTGLGANIPEIYVAMGVKFYAGGTTSAVYKALVTDVTEVSSDWITVTAYVMAPGSYDTNTAIDLEPEDPEASAVYPFVDGKYIGLGLTATPEENNGATVLFDNVTVVAESYMLGDLNSDAVINASDMASLRTHLISGTELSDAARVNADIKKDEAIDVLDLVRLKKYLASAK